MAPSILAWDSLGMDWGNPDPKNPAYLEALRLAFWDRASIISDDQLSAHEILPNVYPNLWLPFYENALNGNIIWARKWYGLPNKNGLPRTLEEVIKKLVPFFINHIDSNGDWTGLQFSEFAPAWTWNDICIEVGLDTYDWPGKYCLARSSNQVAKDWLKRIYKILNLLRWKNPVYWPTFYPPTSIDLTRVSHDTRYVASYTSGTRDSQWASSTWQTASYQNANMYCSHNFSTGGGTLGRQRSEVYLDCNWSGYENFMTDIDIYLYVTAGTFVPEFSDEEFSNEGLNLWQSVTDFQPEQGAKIQGQIGYIDTVPPLPSEPNYGDDLGKIGWQVKVQHPEIMSYVVSKPQFKFNDWL